MAKFNRYDYRWNEYGNRRSESEIDEIERQFNLEQKQKQKNMVKTIIVGVIGFFALIFLFFSC